MTTLEITENINIRTFLHNFTKFKRKKVIITNRNKQKEGVFIPYKEWIGLQKEESKKPRMIKVEDLRKLAVTSGGPSDLSQRVDEIYDL